VRAGAGAAARAPTVTTIMSVTAASTARLPLKFHTRTPMCWVNEY